MKKWDVQGALKLPCSFLYNPHPFPCHVYHNQIRGWPTRLAVRVERVGGGGWEYFGVPNSMVWNRLQGERIREDVRKLEWAEVDLRGKVRGGWRQPSMAAPAVVSNTFLMRYYYPYVRREAPVNFAVHRKRLQVGEKIHTVYSERQRFTEGEVETHRVWIAGQEGGREG